MGWDTNRSPGVSPGLDLGKIRKEAQEEGVEHWNFLGFFGFLQARRNPVFTLMSGAVPSPSKTAGPDNPAKAESLPFEEALKRLEAIVETMESEELPLEKLLGKYEEGTQLARICQAKLAEAELKIQQLERNAAGDLKLKPVSPEDAD
jgi:exodeoxyribonuclease VII small subunit